MTRGFRYIQIFLLSVILWLCVHITYAQNANDIIDEHLDPPIGVIEEYSPDGVGLDEVEVFDPGDQPLMPGRPGQARCCILGLPCCELEPEPVEPDFTPGSIIPNQSSTGIRLEKAFPASVKLEKYFGSALLIQIADGAVAKGDQCPNPYNLPSDVHKELCDPQTAKRVASCEIAASTLLDYRTIDHNKPQGGLNLMYSVRDVVDAHREHGSSTADLLMTFLSILDSYLSECLTPFETYAKLNPKHANVIANKSGIFYNIARPELLCGGALINGFLITARHCVETSVGIANPSGFVFETWAGAQITEVNLSEALTYVRETYEMSLDIIAIPVDVMKSPDVHLHVADSIALGDRLVVAGFNNNSKMKSVIEEMTTGIAPERDGFQHIHIDTGDLCRALVVREDGCILHPCQTDRLMSGAPLFVEKNGELQMAGMQVAAVAGDVSRDGSCWEKDISSFIPNAAIGNAVIEHLIK